MMPFRVCVRVHVCKGRKSFWKSPDVTMLTLDGDTTPKAAIGAGMAVLDVIAHIKNIPLSKLFSIMPDRQ